MDDRRLFQVGAVGAVVAAICCATPLLALLLAAIGVSGAAGWLDYVLLPALAAFVGVMVYAVTSSRKAPRRSTTSSGRALPPSAMAQERRQRPADADR